MKPKQVLQLRVTVELIVMAMKRYSTFSKLEPYQFNVIPRTAFLRYLTTLQKMPSVYSKNFFIFLNFFF